MIELDFKLDIRELEKHLMDIVARMEPFQMEKLLRAIGKLVKKKVRQKFVKGGIEPSWAPLKESTLARRKYKWGKGRTRAPAYSRVPLGGSKGKLGKAISARVVDGGAAVRIAPTSRLAKIVAIQARGQHRGGGLAARNAYHLTSSDVSAIRDVLARWVDRSIGIKKTARTNFSFGRLLGATG